MAPGEYAGIATPVTAGLQVMTCAGAVWETSAEAVRTGLLNVRLREQRCLPVQPVSWNLIVSLMAGGQLRNQLGLRRSLPHSEDRCGPWQLRGCLERLTGLVFCCSVLGLAFRVGVDDGRRWQSWQIA